VEAVTVALIRTGWCNAYALDPYSGGARFEFRSEHNLSWMRFVVFFLSPLRQFRVNTSTRPLLFPSKSFPIHP
jgi:hypothetical protein